MSLTWDFSTVADDIGQVLGAVESELRLEQAVYGIDARDERDLQELLSQRLAAKYEVAREVHYPSSSDRRVTHRLRCDLVLCPLGLPLRPKEAEPLTLFNQSIGDQAFCAPADALWLEVKVAYQFREGGARHGGYGAQWRQNVVADLRKMEADPQIREAGLVLLVFNESLEILNKDLELFEDVLALKEVLAGFRQVRSIPILDRIGHRVCTAALWPTLQR